jgi:hypothetical protein
VFRMTHEPAAAEAATSRVAVARQLSAPGDLDALVLPVIVRVPVDEHFPSVDVIASARKEAEQARLAEVQATGERARSEEERQALLDAEREVTNRAMIVEFVEKARALHVTPPEAEVGPNGFIVYSRQLPTYVVRLVLSDPEPYWWSAEIRVDHPDIWSSRTGKARAKRRSRHRLRDFPYAVLHMPSDELRRNLAQYLTPRSP